MIQFTELQQQQLKHLAIPTSVVQTQIDKFITGFPFLPINRPATVGDGILKLSDAELAHYISLYEKGIANKTVIKLVPASGAASRMFKELFEFVENGNNMIEGNKFISEFIHSIRSFAFYDLLTKSFASKGKNLDTLLDQEQYVEIVNEVISSSALNYGGLPKGLLPFHAYDVGVRTAIEEHFAEGAMYAAGKQNTVNLHFTVAPEHQLLFEKKVAQVQPQFEAHYGVKYHVAFSQQLKSTDTIAVTMDNEPFVEEDGFLLFRPAGHGALLENLNALKADLIFVKNIDNVVPDRLKETTIAYKKAIGGVLLDVQEKVNARLTLLSEENNLKTILDTKHFIEHELNISLPQSFTALNIHDQAEYLYKELNRPMRVCGMVENTGEPGGGPFFIEQQDGSISLQIGETSQLDLNDLAVVEKLRKTSHFNPVDLVCAVTDANGKPFDLLNYRDDTTGFITTKSKGGRELKAQELPGLWNGAMAHWITLFVEVPLSTFNPVKTVNDLLREEHQ